MNKLCGGATPESDKVWVRRKGEDVTVGTYEPCVGSYISVSTGDQEIMCYQV